MSPPRGPPGTAERRGRGRCEAGLAIVVLGAAVRAGGEPSPALRRRVLCAVARAHERPTAVLVPTGGIGRFPPSEAAVMARLAEQSGVARERIRLEERARTTGESALYCAEILAREGIARVLLVTDRFHQRRARLLFRRVGLEVESASPDDDGAPPRERLRRSLREWAGLGWYGLTFRPRPVRRRRASR